MTDYKTLRTQILSDGKLTADEVNQLKKIIYNEEGMNLEKANFLFHLKELASRGEVAHEFLPLFVEAITNFLLEDEDSPGEIDESEAKWLRAKIQYSGHMDEYDSALLKNLKKRSINFPKVLQYKSLHTRTFENILYSSRYLSILAVIGALVSAIALFIEGSIIVFHAIGDFSVNAANGVEVDYEELFEHLVSSVDVFLFALVLIIFGVGVYELFIAKIDPIEREHDTRPSWLQISSVDDLKSSLGKVILMVLIVSFFKHTLEISKNAWTPTALLYLSIGILLISGALYLTHKSHSESHSHK